MEHRTHKNSSVS
jgi:hypothetical protein